MFIGFDYGTANCSVAVIENGAPRLLSLEGDSPFIPSTLCAPTREAVSEYLWRHFDIKPSDQVGEQLLRRAVAFNREEGIDVESGDLRFGRSALATYLEDPEEVYYVKSPKSFLGATGLRDVQVSFFEDLVCAMMSNIKQQAESDLQDDITQAVIGRPVNFQGSGGEKANQQAESILTAAAKRAGFKDVLFQFEPVAAGLEYESTLTQDRTVLVVDIGGGTTDCSLIQMGPSWINQDDRQASLLAHSGCRVGGNDLDIHLAFEQLMPLFGKGSTLQRGIEMPVTQFWNPIAINNVAAQSDFYASANRKALEQLMRDATEPEKIERLIKVHRDTLGYQIVRSAEEAKILLSEQQAARVTLPIQGKELAVNIASTQLSDAIIKPVTKIAELVTEALAQAETKPEVIFMTGGSARSPILRALLETTLPGVPIVAGDYFGSVTSGLARHAATKFA
ncbi:molecular chaperone [Enterovibrio sp. ZSDZ42]|uniref:Molecular chaperone n=1 Tax=Enterovibrio gelatinilyticus TaxID=2899819 RepID=A0ABT5R2N7_9GAMM|nr:molecular chaperone [Enterovibrio sp. ZSDZ42]MDD1794514.1 molecular chaperone [Enterovibrio sp. ZSDZ42]